MSALKKERVEFRASEVAKNKIEEAALISGTTVSKFVHEAVLSKAESVISEHKRLSVHAEQWDSVMNALENPPEATPLMREIIGMSMEETWTINLKK
ncbi:DUF1778 domain-containing protein [Photobacterium sagamiensis]|uniref:type II toxin-antitoxin system TacA family antitoxin n=1 Tax=Photobacterium sagamiensis TaxID=2910241 RepID=UPI003D0CB45F